MRGVAIGRTVHYVAYGTPGGEFPAGKCRAAIITDVGLHLGDLQVIDGEGTPTTVSLMVANPTGLFFHTSVPYDEGRMLPPKGTPPDAPQQRIYRPGSWHWPEQA
jgi:hypothetical protein